MSSATSTLIQNTTGYPNPIIDFKAQFLQMSADSTFYEGYCIFVYNNDTAFQEGKEEYYYEYVSFSYLTNFEINFPGTIYPTSVEESIMRLT